jgi:hypothetical protein
MEKPTYENMKKTFEKHTFKILNPVCYVSFIEGSLNFSLVKESDVVAKYRHMRCESVDDKGKIVKSGFIKKWLDDPSIRLYNKIDFLPPPKFCEEGTFNLWKGFSIENVDFEERDLTIIKNHINILCNHDEKCIDYFTKWLAHIIQFPSELNGIAIVLKSEKGVGKNIACYFLRDIMGDDYFSEITNEESLFGRFSNARRNRLLINIDEVNLSFKNKDQLKNMITSKIYNHEAKGVDPIPMNNFNRFIATTNNDMPVPIEIGDRRMVVISSDNSKKNNLEYIKPLVKFCNDRKNQRAFYEYLKNIDLTKMDWVNDRPLTEEYKDIQSAMIPLEARFIENYIDENKDVQVISCKDLFKEFQDYLSKRGGKSDSCANDKTFGIRMKKYKGLTKKHTKTGQKYIIDRLMLFKYLCDESLNSIDCLQSEFMFADDDEVNVKTKMNIGI